MANRSHTGQKNDVRVQTESCSAARQLEDMPMKHYVNPIPQCREECEQLRRLRELLECQTRLLEKILSVLDKTEVKKDT